jgi:hypothetical protein
MTLSVIPCFISISFIDQLTFELNPKYLDGKVILACTQYHLPILHPEHLLVTVGEP